MARDPNNVALQTVDPDLSTDPDEYSDGGAGDLMDYGASVMQFGENTLETLLTDDSPTPDAAYKPTRRSCGERVPRSVFHPGHDMKTPFTIAACVAVLILVIVLIPHGG